MKQFPVKLVCLAFLPLCLLFGPACVAQAIGESSVEAGAAAPAPSEVELLRTQIALQQQQLRLQQQQLDLLRSTLDAQQQQINQLAGSERARRPEAENVQIASISPSTLSLPASLSTAVPQARTTTRIAPEAPGTGNAAPAARHWYERYTFRGFTQLRHNRLLQTNDELVCEQCDGATAINNNFTFRMARFVLAGDITDKISFSFQPDFAVTNGDRSFGQIRDLFFDLGLDKKKEFRFRVGQSKVPYSFESLQASQNRLALDRNDATISAIPNERDIGVFFYWTPQKLGARFRELNDKGLKGSGDFGVVAAGAFNGQILNKAEANNNLHYVYRVSYPFKLRNGQFIETGAAAYHGKYTVASRTAATRGNPGFLYDDRRVAGSITIYPQPWGFQSEYNYGTGPEYNRRNRFIDQKALSGGYVQAMYMKRLANGMIFTPFYRFTNYAGGKKQELDARHTVVRDHEAGLEYQVNSALEFVLQYAKGFRIFEDAARANWQQSGHQLRLQVQINYK